MKKGIAALLLALALIAPLEAISGPGWGRRNDAGSAWWNGVALIFWAPFDNPAAPLTLNKGAGSLTFTRATTATYTPAGSTTNEELQAITR